MDKELLAYLAGILDGEGHIGIKKLSPKRKRQRTTIDYQSRVLVRMSSEAAISLFHKTFGGSKWFEEKYSSPISKKLLHQWEVRHAKAGVVCETLLPWLRVKTEQAKLVIELQKSKYSTGGRWGKSSTGFARQIDSVTLEHRDGLWKRCSALNH